MNKYDGITSEAFWLLGQNKFNNSKEFYDANKAKLKLLALQPMQQIAQIIAGEMYKIDDLMNLNPVKMISRIRRDTRFSKDKTLYRENIWIMFMRPKTEWPNYPCMWFEITPGGYSYGVSCFDITPRYMDLYRKALIEHPEEFLKAVRMVEEKGAKFQAEYYKKEKKTDVATALKEYYNVKSFYFITQSNDLSVLESNKIINDLKAAYCGFTSMYNFLKCISDDYVSLGE